LDAAHFLKDISKGVSIDSFYNIAYIRQYLFLHLKGYSHALYLKKTGFSV
jgi:hypothetical protein